ncbi:hypothetical protein SpCBS45565_g05450 [Spizellomyces sp. 'palustris']|nr:hypothetical protein SpCBS45565_g05450 [Spizellomyces sp. 'palustris']
MRESVQFAPLSGKVLFRNLRYYSRNQSLSVLRGHITFRYWVSRVRKGGDTAASGSQERPCRIRLRLDGLEWFIYNRTAAYEHLQSVLERSGAAPPADLSRSENISVNVTEDFPSNTPKDMGFRWFLPIDIAATTGAVTIGLPDLPSIFIIHYKEAVGVYEAVKARSLHDFYRTDLNLSLKKVKFSMVTNVDYREPVLNQAARIRSHNIRRPWYRKLAAFLGGGIIWGGMKDEEIPLQEAERHWAGLSRYKVSNVPLLKRRRFEEYAKVTNMLDCRRLELRYYVDIPGPVPRDSIKQELNRDSQKEENDVGNGDLPPEWGLDLTVTDGQLHYGPWTDRQRRIMQSFFFPYPYRNLEKTKCLVPGETRIFVAMKVLIKFEGETTLRIPFREQSKDWKYYDDTISDDENVKVGSTGRPYAWIDLKAKGTSSVDIIVPFIQGENGYSTNVNVALEDLSMLTSLNYSVLLAAQSVRLDCQMENPLRWNGERTWLFTVAINAAQLFLLRDHVTLMTDLIRDWTSGPATSLEYFVPMEYKIKLNLIDFELFFCVNQNNVINQPNDLNDNVYLIVSGPRLRFDVSMPFLHFEEDATTVGFQVESKKTRVRMSFPASHTIGAYLTEEARNVGTLGHLAIEASYRFCNTYKVGNVDSLAMNVEASSVHATIFGFLITHLVYFKENYMGDFNNFVTSDEFRNRTADPTMAETAWRKQEAAKGKSNLFEVHITVVVHNAVAILPENLYDVQEASVLTINEIQVENRNNDHYHDVQINLRPIHWSRTQIVASVVQPNPVEDRNFLRAQDITVRGHRLFGRPPRGAVYAVDWRLTVGQIVGELQPFSLPAIQQALECLSFHYADMDNLLVAPQPLPDITTVQLVLTSIEISVWGQGSVSSLHLAHGLRLQMDNLICANWSERVFIEVPDILIRCLAVTKDKEDTSATNGDYSWVEVLNGRTALSVCTYKQMPNWKEAQARQMDFIKTQDDATQRCTFLYNQGDFNNGRRRQEVRSADDTHWLPYLPLFTPPFKVTAHQSTPREESPVRDIFADTTSSGWSDRAPDSDSDGSRDLDEPSDQTPLADYDTWQTSTDQEPPGVPHQPFQQPAIPRSIPYRSYLKRFKIDTSHRKSHGRSPIMTQFTSVDPEDGETTDADDFYMERPFHRAMRKYRRGEAKVSENSDNEERKMVTVDFSGPLRFLITPIFLRIVQEALENLGSRPLRPESMMDAFQREYTNNLIQIFAYQYTSSSIFVSAPTVHIHCIQDMLLPDVTSFLHDDLPLRYELSDKLLCSFDIVVTGVTGRVKTTTKNPTAAFREPQQNEAKFVVDVERIATKLRFVGNMNAAGIVGIPSAKQHARATPAEGALEGVPVVLDLLAEKIQWEGHLDWRPDLRPGEQDGSSMKISTKDLFVVSINETIEIMFGAIFKWVTFGTDVSKLASEFRARRRKELQRLVSLVAEKAYHSQISGDPVFLTHPSTLWLLGNRRHQNDSGWKLLAHLRYCLRALPHLVKEEMCRLLRNSIDADAKLMYVSILRYLGAWRQWEVSDLSTTPLLRGLYNVKPPVPSTATATNIEALSRILNWKGMLDVARLDITIIEFQNDDSSITVGPIVISGKSRVCARDVPDLSAECDFEYDVDAQVGNLNGSRSSSGCGHLDVRCRARVERVDTVVNPNLFGFVRHFLRVHRWFQARLESTERNNAAHKQGDILASLSSASETTLLRGLPVVFFGTGLVARLSITAAAHNLVAQATLRNIQSCSMHVANKRTQDIDEEQRGHLYEPSHLLHNTVVTVADVNVSMYERTVRAGKLQDTATLISLELGEISGTASVSQSSSTDSRGSVIQPSEVLSLATVVRYAGLRLPRSLLKLHTFLEKWGDEDLPRYDFLFNRLVREWDSGQLDVPVDGLNRSTSSKIGNLSRPRFESIRLEFLLSHLSIQSDLLASLSFFYDAHNLLIGISQEDSPAALGGAQNMLRTRIGWEARLASHTVKFLARKTTSKTYIDEASTDNQWTTFDLPTASSKGSVVHGSPQSQTMPGESLETVGQPVPLQQSKRIEATLELDLIEASLDVSIIDQLITAQNVLGGELNDILEVFAFYSRKKAHSKRGANHQKAKVAGAIPRILYALKITVQGLRISAESPNSIIIFESDPLNGFVTNFPQSDVSTGSLELPTAIGAATLSWRFVARRFSLSLILNMPNWQQWRTNTRAKMHPLAYVLMGLTVQNYGPAEAAARDFDNLEMLYIQIHKLHAVLQPTAMTSMAEAGVFYTKELDRRKQQKAKEIKRAKENTTRFLKGIRLPLSHERKDHSFFENRVILVKIRQIGAAIPLREHERNFSELLENTSPGPISRRNTMSGSGLDPVPAFLVSAKEIQLDSMRLKSAAGRITDLCFQFVPIFEAANDKHFSPSGHPNVNRIILQLINAEFHRTLGQDRNIIRVNSGIRGFELEVDATITEYLNQLNAIYVREREKVAQSLPVDECDDQDKPVTTEEELQEDDGHTNHIETNGGSTGGILHVSFEGRFEFEAGSCKLWSARNKERGAPAESPALSTSQLSSTGSASQRTGETSNGEDPCLHVLTLPGLTLLTVGRTIIGPSSKPASVGDDSLKGVHFELVIHPTHNVLHPDIVTFFRDVNANLKLGRILKHQEELERGVNNSNQSLDKKPRIETDTNPTFVAYQRHKITFYLRLSRTKVSLSCQPASKVSCNFNLDEADFMFSFLPKGVSEDRTQYISCTANILGTSGALRHAFSPEDCLNAEIPRVTFSVTMIEQKHNRTYAIEIGVPSLIGNLNARHLQDFFLFQRMWLDHPSQFVFPSGNLASSAPEFEDDNQRQRSSLFSLGGDAVHALTDHFNVAARINQIEFAMDLGQAIGKATVGLENVVVSGSVTKSTFGFEKKAGTFKCQTIGVKSEGRFSGITTIAGVHFCLDARRPLRTNFAARPSFVGMEAALRVDHIGSQLQYQYERILIVHVSPLHGGLTDQWTLGDDGPELCSSADIKVDTFKAIMSRRTIPTLVHLAKRLRALIEEKRGIDSVSANASNRGDTVSSSPSTGSFLLRPQDRVRSPSTVDTGLPSPTAMSKPLHRASFAKSPWGPLVGRIRLVLGEAFVILTRYNFRDPDFAQIVSKRFEVYYEGSASAVHRAAESTSFELGGFSVKKGAAKPISQAEESMWSTAQWFAFMTAAATKNVFGVPSTKIKLATETFLEEPKVEFSFRTDFGGPIDVALNFGLYKYLQDLVQLYQKAVARSESTKSENAGRTTGPSPTNGGPSPLSAAPTKFGVSTASLVSQSSNDGVAPLAAKAGSPGDAKANALPDRGGDERDVQFIRTGDMVFEPQLKVTGDATPWEWVEWLGVHKEKVPRLLYEQVTMNFAEFLDTLTKFREMAAID